MQILGFYGTLDQARAVRDEMLVSGFTPLEVGIYGGAETPAEERRAWFGFAGPRDQHLYQEATRRGATAVVVDLARQPSELSDGEVAIEILERHGPVDVALWARGWAGNSAQSDRQLPAGSQRGPIADWCPAEPLADGATMRHGLRCHRGADADRPEGVPGATAVTRFVREFSALAAKHGRDWNSAEPELQRLFAARYPGTNWDIFRDHLQQEYDHFRGSEVHHG
jgi:hypothetical protein